ncbi:MAG: fasciclin domain-containing protein [Saprospiraceae bacterium]|nr:fasciclin domain-containing protein [Saprospiraceae bacterium]MCB9326181.1 fasciclin domain-containing protein [Lewinellaceae bacterium]
MQNLKFLFSGLLILSLFTFTSCDDTDDPTPTPEPKDIVETAMATDDLSMLVDAVVQAGLVETLQGDGPFTVFAPTNAAFQALLDSNPAWNSLSDIDNATLANILKFHVIAADVKSTDLTDSYVTTLAAGPNDEQVVLQVDVTGGVKFNGSATPATVDVATTNGTVHIINEVMLPPSVVNLALNNPAFSTLVAALTRSDLTTDYVSILSGNGPFTVFAPTNEAFQALLDSNPDWNGLDDIPVTTLEAVLNYHVVSGANVQSKDLTNQQEVTALGGTFTIDLTDGPKIKTTSNQTVGITFTDVQGANGVVHVIDAILLP